MQQATDEGLARGALFEAFDAIQAAASHDERRARELRLLAQADALCMFGHISEDERACWHARLHGDEIAAARLEELRPRALDGYEIRAVFEEPPQLVFGSAPEQRLAVFSVPLGARFPGDCRFVCWAVYRCGSGPLEWVSDHPTLTAARKALWGLVDAQEVAP